MWGCFTGETFYEEGEGGIETGSGRIGKDVMAKLIGDNEWTVKNYVIFLFLTINL